MGYALCLSALERGKDYFRNRSFWPGADHGLLSFQIVVFQSLFCVFSFGVPANGGSEGWPVGLANLNGGVRQSQPSLATLPAHSLENADAPIV